ncbi:potassium/sodium hyperpolarization-activated cyclic nucleotide-gated channel 3-like [Ostrinia nubilalis]|uniref:potassium/sodium hyperpolarization-activated cyclic nucleotide-gated channel 3-like n=1 Tax=Ostrinia nubilalis TaxID=29057 RepID=UPI0030822437
MTRKKHYCSLELGSDSMLPPQPAWSAGCRALRKACLISEKHPATYLHFRSYPTVIAERQRQLNEGGPYVIHPFSFFSLVWNTVMSVLNIAHMVLSSLRLCFVLHAAGPTRLHPVDHALLALHICCLADIVVMFHVGYLEGRGNVILDRSLIACRYVRSWFFVDLISSLPVSYVLLYHRPTTKKYVLIGHILAVLKSVRICRDMNHIVTFMKIFRKSYICYGTIRNLILFLLSAHWCSCCIYVPPVLNYYWTGKMVRGFNSFLNSTNLNGYPIGYRYQRSIFICLSAFMGAGFSMYRVYAPFEVIINASLILYAALFMIYTLVYLIKVYITSYHSVIRYHELMSQLEEYMRHKQFPAQLKKRVFAFYYYQYQGNYFREDLAFDTLSEQLRNEIVLHTCHKLVDKVELFDGLPASVVGSVLGCLRAEVYLPNDLVVRAGDIGDCMYFIASGTVAVYSLKGVEVCHLVDGAHFGEVALLMKDSKRVATVVAVEITQVYRLDAEDFRHFIVSYQVLFERIEALASQRMHETVLLDEAFRRNREKFAEHTQSSQELNKTPTK